MLRRTFLAGAGCMVPALELHACSTDPSFGGGALRRGMAALEADARGRMGVAVLDTGTGARFAWRGHERFPMCSTFKFILAAAILESVERCRDRLDRRVSVRVGDLVENSPFTEGRTDGSASVAELCQATIARSDNAAANLLLPAVGGPAGLTRYIRASGDDRTRLDRNEPSLNEARPGDPRDTTTPVAMLRLLDRLALGNGLSPPSRERLVAWMRGSVTGDRRLRAGLPAGWRVADKTGAGNGSDNEVAILWPPARRPLLVASYIAASPLNSARTNAIHARLGSLIPASVRTSLQRSRETDRERS